MTEYVVLHPTGNNYGGEDHPEFYVVAHTEAANAEQARRRVGEGFDDGELAAGVELIAVPARNWRTGRGTVKVETTRRIRST